MNCERELEILTVERPSMFHLWNEDREWWEINVEETNKNLHNFNENTEE